MSEPDDTPLTDEEKKIFAGGHARMFQAIIKGDAGKGT
jgi:hypothetical protein